MAHTISVCDRESDVYEYLEYKLRNAQRFVIRAKVDRRVCASEEPLFEHLARDADELSCYTVNIVQRGGRPLSRIHALRGTCTSVCGAKRDRPACNCAVCD